VTRWTAGSDDEQARRGVHLELIEGLLGGEPAIGALTPSENAIAIEGDAGSPTAQSGTSIANETPLAIRDALPPTADERATGLRVKHNRHRRCTHRRAIRSKGAPVRGAFKVTSASTYALHRHSSFPRRVNRCWFNPREPSRPWHGIKSTCPGVIQVTA
jgi:hypothetical protein